MKDLGLVLRSDREPLGVLKEDRAELPALAQRLEADPEARVDLVQHVLRKVLRVEALLLERLLRKRLAQLLRQALRIGVVRRECREGFEVHHEFVRRALRPELRLLLIGDRVIGRVVLDEREALRVVAQAFVGLLRDVLRIPARFEERRIRPRARADEDLGLGHLGNSAPRGWTRVRSGLPLPRTARGRAPRPWAFAGRARRRRCRRATPRR